MKKPRKPRWGGLPDSAGWWPWIPWTDEEADAHKPPLKRDVPVPLIVNEHGIVFVTGVHEWHELELNPVTFGFLRLTVARMGGRWGRKMEMMPC